MAKDNNHYDRAIWIRASSFIKALMGERIYRSIGQSFVGGVVYKIFGKPSIKDFRKRAQNPSPAMLESREYFGINKDRIDKISANFVDDTSRDVYLKMIDWRCNMNVDNFPASDETAHYFYNEYFVFGKDEVFVDCGAFDGDTISEFKHVIKKRKGSIKRIVAFEPDSFNYGLLVKNHKDIIAIKTGVWSRDATLSFVENGNSESAVTSEIDSHMMGGGIANDCTATDSKDSPDNGDTWGNVIAVPVRCIDNVPECEGVTILKMDIEGSELPALRGAYNTIKKYKPRLAICIYHSDEEMITIPEWINENFPEYKLFVRQHSKFNFTETVLYGFV